MSSRTASAETLRYRIGGLGAQGAFAARRVTQDETAPDLHAHARARLSPWRRAPHLWDCHHSAAHPRRLLLGDRGHRCESAALIHDQVWKRPRKRPRARHQ